MKKIIYYFIRYIAFSSLIVLFIACDPTSANELPKNVIVPTQTETAEPTSTPILTPTLYNSAPEDPELDRNCRETINFFFSYRKGFDPQVYRNLFAKSAGSIAEPPPDPPLEPATILVLMPASEWWQKNYPATPIPGIYLPEEPGEYIYYVEYSGHYEPNDTPPVPVIYPDAITMIMVQEGPGKACRIKNYGKG